MYGRLAEGSLHAPSTTFRTRSASLLSGTRNESNSATASCMLRFDQKFSPSATRARPVRLSARNDPKRCAGSRDVVVDGDGDGDGDGVWHHPPCRDSQRGPHLPTTTQPTSHPPSHLRVLAVPDFVAVAVAVAVA